jgi:hypothetical protein
MCSAVLLGSGAGSWALSTEAPGGSVRPRHAPIVGTVESLSVGEMAGRLGVAPSTVRMWGTRYGLTASLRTPGGHRRYTPDDVERLERMHAAVIAGASPAAAAADVLRTPDAVAEKSAAVPAGRRSGRRGGPGGAVLAVPGAGREVQGLARAASRLDAIAVTDAVVTGLHDRGTVAVWDETLRPLLVAAGDLWARTGAGIEVEHVLTQAVTAALIRYTGALPDVARADPILLAGGPLEDHVLPLHAVRAALAERGVPARFLGPRTPMAVIAKAARLTRAPAVLVWSVVSDPSAAEQLPSIGAAHRTVRLLIGGPGWPRSGTGPAVLCSSIGEAVHQLERSWRARRGAPAR